MSRSKRRNSRSQVTSAGYDEYGYAYEYEDEYEYEQRKKEALRKYKLKKKKRKRRKRMFLSIFLLMAVLTGYVAARMQLEINSTLDVISRNEAHDLSNVDVSGIDLVGDDEVLNILLVGSDKRANQTDIGRSDSLMIASLDMRNKQLKLTSIMRDTYLEIPGYMNNRFNTAYSLGGIPLVYQTIATNFKIRLDGYVLVDFDSFTHVIDQIGGVDISITQSEYDHLIKYYANKSYKKDVEKLSPGMNTMTGRQALCYARIRKEGNGDYRRTERQREVIQAIFSKAKKMSLTDLYDMMKSVLPYIETDLTNDEIVSYAISVLKMGTTEINQYRVPADHTFTEERIRGMDVLVPDIEENTRLLQEFIYNKVELEQEEEVSNN